MHGRRCQKAEADCEKMTLGIEKRSFLPKPTLLKMPRMNSIFPAKQYQSQGKSAPEGPTEMQGDLRRSDQCNHFLGREIRTTFLIKHFTNAVLINGGVWPIKGHRNSMEAVPSGQSSFIKAIQATQSSVILYF